MPAGMSGRPSKRTQAEARATQNKIMVERAKRPIGIDTPAVTWPLAERCEDKRRSQATRRTPLAQWARRMTEKLDEVASVRYSSWQFYLL